MSGTRKEDSEELEWINLRKEINKDSSYQHNLNFKDKFTKKVKSNPVVPIGAVLTFGALIFGLNAMRTGNKKMSQNMMRLRVSAQGLTIIALVSGIMYSVSKK